jgi:hypothetical protein
MLRSFVRSREACKNFVTGIKTVAEKKFARKCHEPKTESTQIRV